jgi:hypothetical protein
VQSGIPQARKGTTTKGPAFTMFRTKCTWHFGHCSVVALLEADIFRTTWDLGS